MEGELTKTLPTLASASVPLLTRGGAGVGEDAAGEGQCAGTELGQPDAAAGGAG